MKQARDISCMITVNLGSENAYDPKYSLKKFLTANLFSLLRTPPQKSLMKKLFDLFLFDNFMQSNKR